MKTFPYTYENKHYHTYNYFLRTRYHGKVAKVALNADFTCPNRDGTKGLGGCLFCSAQGAGEFAGDVNETLLKQFESESLRMREKWPNALFVAYFQAFTNTYAPLSVLKERFEPFVHRQDVVGIAIATRPDCINEEIAEYLGTLNQSTDIYVELGLQTIHDATAQAMNRGYRYEVFLEALQTLRKHGIDVIVHIINGLPGEDKDMMMETAKALGKLDIQGLKIHNLYITYDSQLYQQYVKEPFPLLSRDEYIALVAHQLEWIDKEIVIERLTGDAKKEELYEPKWSRIKRTILNDIDKYMKAMDLYQGDMI